MDDKKLFTCTYTWRGRRYTKSFFTISEKDAELQFTQWQARQIAGHQMNFIKAIEKMETERIV